jgi:hypothetical protein
VAQVGLEAANHSGGNCVSRENLLGILKKGPTGWPKQQTRPADSGDCSWHVGSWCSERGREWAADSWAARNLNWNLNFKTELELI